MTEEASPHPATEEIALLQAFIDDLPQDETARQSEEAMAIEFANQIQGFEERQVAIDALIKGITTLREAPEMKALREEHEDYVYGKGIIETEPSDLSAALERLLSGKNPAVVVRAGAYQDFKDDILMPIREQGPFRLSRAEPEVFPNASMKRANTANSVLHLDILPEKPGTERFPYTLSLSKVKQGRVLFMAGIASAKSKGWSQLDYDARKTAFGQLPSVKRMNDMAEHDNAPQSRDWHINEAGFDLDMSAVVLGEEDIVIWPQGGPGSTRASWHVFRQVGSEPRVSTSYHFVPDRSQEHQSQEG